jgi:AbrB family looped-hinge helix DNA binding protein
MRRLGRIHKRQCTRQPRESGPIEIKSAHTIMKVLGPKKNLPLHVIPFILQSMKIGERGQVTIPKELRHKFGLKPETEVEFQVVNNAILLRKKPRKLALTRWKGRCKKSFEELGYTRVDEFIEDVRGR